MIYDIWYMYDIWYIRFYKNPFLYKLEIVSPILILEKNKNLIIHKLYILYAYILSHATVMKLDATLTELMRARKLKLPLKIKTI